jgi:MoxR-like ATPase
VAQVLVDADDAIRLLLTALLADGHALLEDVPGTGKTSLAKAFARTLGLSFGRVQFTPDLLPSDVTGLSWFNQERRQFEFRPGPVFTQILLADEINRATPRTQSALLEAMAERQVTVDGQTHALPRPFLVLATQNPVELEGTFPLPEAQIDRFLVRFGLGYPDAAGENELLVRHADVDPLVALRPLVGLPDLDALRAGVRAVTVNDVVRGYIVDLCRATREHSGVELGVSPRGTLYLQRAAQAWAAMAGRDFVLPDDVKAVARPVLAHRIAIDPATELRGGAVAVVLDDVLSAVPVPVEA